jgi:hypothetical protein
MPRDGAIIFGDLFGTLDVLYVHLANVAAPVAIGCSI